MWLFSAFIFAFVSSIGPIIAKKVMQEMDEYFFIWLSGIFTIPLLFLTILYFYQIPEFDRTFLFSVLGSVVLDVIAAICAYRAIKVSEISLIAPLAAFNPVFTTLISFLMLGEVIALRGIIGIALVCVGAYSLQLSKIKRGWFTPLVGLMTHRGVQLSFIAYFLWAITPILQKTAIFHTNPQVPPFVGLMGLLGTTIIFTFFVAKKSKNRFFLMKKYIWVFMLVGILGIIANISAFTAFSLANLGFVTAIFKLSMIFTVIFGWIFFRERNIQDKLLGAFTMLIGVVLLTIKV